MPHIVKLTEQDKLLLINLLAESYEYKMEKKLRNQDSIHKMGEYYIDAIEKIRDNYIEVRNPKNCFFTWLIDNLRHSGDKIWNSADGQEADLICLEASKGTYDYRKRLSRGLFEICP